MSKSSTARLPALAGTLAGLAVAGLGAWYFSTHTAEAAPPAAVAAATAPASTAGAALSREQAVQKLMALPELQALAEQIEQRSGGKLHGALMEYDSQPRDVDGQPYYQFTFVENGEDAVQPYDSFLVSHARGDILVEDSASGELLTLQRWRQDNAATQR